MLNQPLEESIGNAKQALKEAKSENIIALCEEYLSVLNEFRTDLYKFQGKAEISLQQSNADLHKEALGKRGEIRTAITQTIEELNQTTTLLNRLTSNSGYDTIETFNRLNYKNHSNWEFRGGIVRFGNGSEADQIAIQEAVDIAVRLRCDEYVNPKIVQCAQTANS